MIEAEGSKADNTEHIHDENEKQWEAYLLLLRRRAKNKSNSKGSPLVRGRAGRRTGTRVLMSPTTRQRQRPRPGPAAPASPSLRQAPAPVPFHTPPSFLPSPSVLSRLQTPSTPVGTREDAATATCRQTSAPCFRHPDSPAPQLRYAGDLLGSTRGLSLCAPPGPFASFVPWRLRFISSDPFGRGVVDFTVIARCSVTFDLFFPLFFCFQLVVRGVAVFPDSFLWRSVLLLIIWPVLVLEKVGPRCL